MGNYSFFHRVKRKKPASFPVQADAFLLALIKRFSFLLGYCALAQLSTVDRRLRSNSYLSVLGFFKTR